MRRTRYIILLIAWLVAIAAGGWWQLRYEQTPGHASASPATYPGEGPITPQPGRTLVIMALHPRCPCTRASLAELSLVASRKGAQPDIVVLACSPQDAGPDWTDAESCATARAIPGVNVVADRGGRAAARLGMKTSGHVVVYDTRQRLVFSGGITAGRGVTGPNPGLDAVIAALDAGAAAIHDRQRSAPPAVTPVYGCELVAPDACASVCGENGS